MAPTTGDYYIQVHTHIHLCRCMWYERANKHSTHIATSIRVYIFLSAYYYLFFCNTCFKSFY